MKYKLDLRFIFIFLIVLYRYTIIQYMMPSDVNLNLVNISLYLLPVVVILVLIFRKKININMFTLIGTSVISFIQIYFLHEIDIFLVMLVGLLYLKDKDAIYKIILNFTISLIIVFIMTIIMCFTGMLESYSTIGWIDKVKYVYYTFGFIHPNVAYGYFLFIMLGLYYLIPDKKCVFRIIFLFLSFAMYAFTHCRTGFLCSIVFLLISFLYYRKIKVNWSLFIICTGITVLIALYGVNNGLDSLLSGRPHLFNYYLMSGSLFFLKSNHIVSQYILDNMYFYILASNGMIIFGYYIYNYVKSGILIEKDRKLTHIFIIVLIYGITESHSINIGINFMLCVQMYLILSNCDVISYICSWLKNKKLLKN